MTSNIGNTNRVSIKIIAKANLIFRPHFISDIENQAMQCASRTWSRMCTGKLKMQKSQMPINYGRVSFVEQGNQINIKTIWVGAEYIPDKLNIEVNLDFYVRTGHNNFQFPLFRAQLRA